MRVYQIHGSVEFFILRLCNRRHFVSRLNKNLRHAGYALHPLLHIERGPDCKSVKQSRISSCYLDIVPIIAKVLYSVFYIILLYA